MQIINGDSRDVLTTFPDNHFDSVVCDPPYELTSISGSAKRIVRRSKSMNFFDGTGGSKGSSPYSRTSKGFMGQQWDATGISFDPEFWSEVLRVLKPGGFLVSTGGTRTYHRLVCAIEDAGFEIKDSMAWIFGSGFPKSRNVSKDLRSLDPCVGPEDQNTTTGLRCPNCGKVKRDLIPDGWGTALKPAMELICLARKPLSEKSVAANVLRWGCGALNIDGCRVPIAKEEADSILHRLRDAKNRDHRWFGERDNVPQSGINKGRWPANLLHDNSDDVLFSFPPKTKGCLQPGKHASSGYQQGGGQGAWRDSGPYETVRDEGSAARFFASFPPDGSRAIYCAKSSVAEREMGLENEVKVPSLFSNSTRLKKNGDGTKRNDKPSRANHHPTIKPLALMRYLVKLITPPNGLILDCFMGSGSTGIAAIQEGFDFVGIEKDEAYFAIAEKRLAYVLPQQPSDYEDDGDNEQSKS